MACNCYNATESDYNQKALSFPCNVFARANEIVVVTLPNLDEYVGAGSAMVAADLEVVEHWVDGEA